MALILHRFTFFLFKLLLIHWVPLLFRVGTRAEAGVCKKRKKRDHKTCFFSLVNCVGAIITLFLGEDRVFFLFFLNVTFFLVEGVFLTFFLWNLFFINSHLRKEFSLFLKKTYAVVCIGDWKLAENATMNLLSLFGNQNTINFIALVLSACWREKKSVTWIWMHFSDRKRFLIKKNLEITSAKKIKKIDLFL